MSPVRRSGSRRLRPGDRQDREDLGRIPFRLVDGTGLQGKRPGPFGKAFGVGESPGIAERVHDTCRRFVQALRWVQVRQLEPHGSVKDDFARSVMLPSRD